MKFPRNARMFTGHLDAAPFACVLFCLLVFLLLALVVPIPGIPIHLPASFPGQTNVVTAASGPTITVALDVGGPQHPHGLIYFQNQTMEEKELERRLREAVKKSPQPLTLVLLSDRDVPVEQCYHLIAVAQAAGIKSVSLGIQAGILDSPAGARIP